MIEQSSDEQIVCDLVKNKAASLTEIHSPTTMMQADARRHSFPLQKLAVSWCNVLSFGRYSEHFVSQA